jgi:hypothetical protein
MVKKGYIQSPASNPGNENAGKAYSYPLLTVIESILNRSMAFIVKVE